MPEPEGLLNFFRKRPFARRHLEQPLEARLAAPHTFERTGQVSQGLGTRILMRPSEDAREDR